MTLIFLKVFSHFIEWNTIFAAETLIFWNYIVMSGFTSMPDETSLLKNLNNYGVSAKTDADIKATTTNQGNTCLTARSAPESIYIT